MISLADVVARYDGNKHEVKKPEIVVFNLPRETPHGDGRLCFDVGYRNVNGRGEIPFFTLRGPDVEDRDWCKGCLHIDAEGKIRANRNGRATANRGGVVSLG